MVPIKLEAGSVDVESCVAFIDAALDPVAAEHAPSKRVHNALLSKLSSFVQH